MMAQERSAHFVFTVDVVASHFACIESIQNLFGYFADNPDWFDSINISVKEVYEEVPACDPS